MSLSHTHQKTSRLALLMMFSWVAIVSLGGCAAFHPMSGVPARYLPDELRGPSRADQRTIDLSLLRQPVPAAYLLDSGDVLGVYIEGLLGRKEDVPPVHFPLTNDVPPSLGYPLPVREDGTISLPVIGALPVRGLTIIQAEQAVRHAYSSPKQILQPHQRISLALQQPRLYRVLVIRQEASQQANVAAQGQLNIGVIKRGSGKIVALPAYKNDVLHALTDTGGLPGLDAENAVYIIRARHAGQHGQPPYPATIQATPVSQKQPSRPRLSLNSGRNAQNQPVIRGQSADPYADVNWSGNRSPRQNHFNGFSDPALQTNRGYPSHPTSSSHPALPGFSQPTSQIAPPNPSAYGSSPAPSAAYNSGGPVIPARHQTDQLAAPPGPTWRGNEQSQEALPYLSNPHGNYLPPQNSPLEAAPTYGVVTGSPVIPWDGTQRFATDHQMFGAPTPAFFDGYQEDSIPTIDNPEIIRIPIRLKPGEQIDFHEHDITLNDGDIIFIESRDTDVFYTGGLLGGGQYTLPRDYDVDILGAIAIAQGQGRSQGSSRQIGGTSALNNDVTISASNAIVIRPMPDGTQVPIQINLYHALRNPAERIIIQPGDYILLQYTKLEACGAFIERNLLEGALFGVAAAQLNSNNGN